MNILQIVLIVAFFVTQILYVMTFAIDIYIFSRPVNTVDIDEDGANSLAPVDYPKIVLFYPVLRELEETMRTTFIALDRLDYPRDRYSIVAIPNDNDLKTIASLERLQKHFDFLEIMPVPPTTDSSWQTVWDAWESNKKAYWFHNGARAGVRDLPPKKTRQLIYAFYTREKAHREQFGDEDFLVNYIDADSAPPRDHFKAAAIGIKHFDVLQATNIAGNLLKSMPSSLFALDHIQWDASKYRHLTANGHHPFWVLGKGLFFKASDLVELGGFHPWITIEDPEVGMRFWKNGRKLGVIEHPLVEEVPETFRNGITQRKRWVAGFFQSLNQPLREMGFTRMERFKAWTNFLPCLSLWVNALGIPVGIWAVAAWYTHSSPLPAWSIYLSGLNIILFLAMMIKLYATAWIKTKVVIPRKRDRLWYLLRVNPIVVMLFWILWVIPLWLGWRMYRQDTGLVWERTTKINANSEIIRKNLIANER